MSVPEGLTRCPDCGEYHGEVRNGDLSDPTGTRNLIPPDTGFAVRCICDGISCQKCKENKIPRPISNRYEVETNTIYHIPYFGYMMSCAACKKRERNRTP